MGKGRNTGGLACGVSHRCTDVYLGLDLQTRLGHPMVLLESFPQRELYHHPMINYQNLWITVLCWVWVCGSDVGCGILVVKVLFSCGLGF